MRLNIHCIERVNDERSTKCDRLEADLIPSFVISFIIRKDMVPRTRVVVYHILPDGEVVADALDFDVMGTFQNTVSGSGC